jgi:WD40 repeat protein
MEYANSSTPYVTVSSTDEFKTQLIRPRPTLSAEYIVEGVKRHKYATFATVLFVVVAAIGFSVYKYNGATPPSPQENVAGINDSTIESDLKFSKLPISEQVRDIVISPDGKYVAYMPSKGIRLLELETSSDTEVSNEENIWGLRFSPDSQYVYYSFGNEQNRTEGIKRLSIRGGASVKVLNDPLDGVSFSRDGATMVFTRELRDGTAIVLANPDGSNERTLANTRRVVNVPLFSPDDKTIACQMEVKDESGSFYKIIGIDVTDGKQRVLSDKKWNAAIRAASDVSIPKSAALDRAGDSLRRPGRRGGLRGVCGCTGHWPAWGSGRVAGG